MIPAEREIISVLRSIQSVEPNIAPTLLYNEGWLLRLVLVAAARGCDCLPFQIVPGSRWYSEACLASAFRARFRGDPLAETHTHADGAVGQFHFANTKSGVTLTAQCCQLAVCEAKLFSPLSSGTTRAPGFDQAARTVACMAEALSRAGRPLSEYRSLAFIVLAPASEITTGNFARLVSRDHIKERIVSRVSMYRGTPDFDKLENWLRDWALPTTERLQLACCDWESILITIGRHDHEYGAELSEFYRLCKHHNSPLDVQQTVETAV